jgi:hypothetical protein
MEDEINRRYVCLLLEDEVQADSWKYCHCLEW